MTTILLIVGGIIGGIILSAIWFIWFMTKDGGIWK